MVSEGFGKFRWLQEVSGNFRGVAVKPLNFRVLKGVSGDFRGVSESLKERMSEEFQACIRGSQEVSVLQMVSRAF